MTNYIIGKQLKEALSNILNMVTYGQLTAKEVIVLAKKLQQKATNDDELTILNAAVKLSGISPEAILAIYNAKEELSKLEEVKECECVNKQKNKAKEVK